MDKLLIEIRNGCLWIYGEELLRKMQEYRIKHYSIITSGIAYQKSFKMSNGDIVLMHHTDKFFIVEKAVNRF